jgi:hypothetical protein
MPANDFAIQRMEPGKQRPIQSMEEARDWERLFIGEAKAGRDPSRTPTRSAQVNTEITSLSAFLDAYLERCVKPGAMMWLHPVIVGAVAQALGDAAIRCFRERSSLAERFSVPDGGGCPFPPVAFLASVDGANPAI